MRRLQIGVATVEFETLRFFPAVSQNRRNEPGTSGILTGE